MDEGQRRCCNGRCALLVHATRPAHSYDVLAPKARAEEGLCAHWRRPLTNTGADCLEGVLREVERRRSRDAREHVSGQRREALVL